MRGIYKTKSFIGGTSVVGTSLVILMMFLSDGGLSTYVSAIEFIKDDIVDLEKKDIVFEEYIKYDIEKMSVLQAHYDKIITNISELRSIACKDSTSNLC